MSAAAPACPDGRRSCNRTSSPAARGGEGRYSLRRCPRPAASLARHTALSPLTPEAMAEAMGEACAFAFVKPCRSFHSRRLRRRLAELEGDFDFARFGGELQDQFGRFAAARRGVEREVVVGPPPIVAASPAARLEFVAVAVDELRF